MKIHKFFCRFEFAGDSLSVSQEDIIHQVKDVLKLKPKERLVFNQNDGIDYLCEIMAISKRELTAKIVEKERNGNETDREVVLYCSILKRENFELAAQKATEIGVTNIVPLITERTIKTNLNRERLRKIVREAAEQSDRGIIPDVEESAKFNQLPVDHEALNLFCDFNGRSISELPLKYKKVNLFVGPEGGWTDAEREFAKQSGFVAVSLGKTVLRGETAAIVATYAIISR